MIKWRWKKQKSQRLQVIEKPEFDLYLCFRCQRCTMRPGYLYCNGCLGLGVKKPEGLNKGVN